MLHYLPYFCCLFFLFGWGQWNCQAQIMEDQAAAVQLAQKKHKAILLVFSGSDWCQPCIRFDKQVLQQEAFLSFAQANLVVLKCDFPQRKALSPQLLKQNEALAEQFNPEGSFPKLLLLDAQLEVLAPLNYQNQALETFIKQIDQQLPLKTGYQEAREQLEQPPKKYKKRIPAMGSFFEFIIVGDKAKEAENWALIERCVQEVNRIEQLISEWTPSSEISKINQQAGKAAVTVSPEVYDLLERALALSDLTQGAFDLTFLAYYKYWDFKNPNFSTFDTAKIKALGAYVDYTKIQLLPQYQVQLPAQFQLGLGGIGQGYAVDRVKQLLLEAGVQNFVVNGSGDVYAQGKDLDGKPWRVGIASPLDRERILRWLPVDNFAVVTSGTSERNFTHKGKLYSHIIHPKTGFPIQGLQSATVISPYTEVADALATSLLILGKDLAFNLINQLPNTHCILIDETEQIYYSKNLQLNETSIRLDKEN